MTDFNVLTEFRAALKDSPDPDPANVARQVAAAVPARHRADALAQALVRLAPVVAGNMRQAAFATVPLGRDRWSGAGEVYRAHLLDQRIVVGDGSKKFVRDCTAEDLRAAAERNREHARATIERAEQYEALAALLVKRGARTVGDLDRDDLDGLGAAA